MIDKLSGRDRIIWLQVSNKINEVIETLNRLEEEVEKLKQDK